eukprot:9502973-Pyramimonas_sp.AAC.1
MGCGPRMRLCQNNSGSPRHHSWHITSTSRKRRRRRKERRSEEEVTRGAVSSKRGPNTTGWLGKNVVGGEEHGEGAGQGQ